MVHQHDPEKRMPVFRKDHAQRNDWSGMLNPRNRIPLQR